MSDKKPAKSWSTTGRQGREKSWNADLEAFNFADHKDKYVQVRLVTQSIAECIHWAYLETKHAIAHSKGAKPSYKEARAFPVVCPDFDPIEESGTPKTCPICVLFNAYVRSSLNYYCWAYVGVPSKKGSNVRWLEDPVVLKLGQAIVIGIQNCISLKGGNDPADSKNGYFINIMMKANPATPLDTYNVQAGDAMRLTKEQRLAVKELPDLMDSYKPTSPESIKASMQQKGYYDLLDGSDMEDSEEDDEDEIAVGKSKKSSKKVTSKKSKHADEDEDEDSDDDSDDDDEEEEKKPKKKKAVESKSKKSKYDDDDEEEEDEDEDDEDDIPAPKSKKASSKVTSKKSKRDVEDDDDEEEDDDDDDDEDEDGDDDDVPAPRNSTSAKKKLAAKESKKPSKKTVIKKKSRHEEDDD